MFVTILRRGAIVLALLAVLVVGVVSTDHAHTAHADGAGGAMLRVVCPLNITSVEFEGTNQYYNFASWYSQTTYDGDSEGDGESPSMYAVTNNWWWIGTVDYWVWDTSGQAYYAQAYVDPSYYGGTQTVPCP